MQEQLTHTVSVCTCASVTLTWRWCVLVGPLEEATLLLSGLPAGVEHAALVRAVLLHGARHRRLVAVAHHLPHVAGVAPGAGGRVPRRLGRLWCLQRWPSGRGQCWRPLLARLIGPQEEVAAPGAALVELAALVGAVLAHRQEDGILTAVAHDDVAVGGSAT